MKVFYAALCLVIAGLAVKLAYGGTADRRYSRSDCNYRLIYENKGPVDLAMVGGSRFLTAMDSDDLSAYLKARRGYSPVLYNVSHSHFAIEKEYVIIRDLLDERKVKTVVVMMQPRNWSRNIVHEDFYKMATLGDAVTIVGAAATEDPFVALSAAGRVVLEHLKPSQRLASCTNGSLNDSRCRRHVHRKDPTRNCHSGDYRFDVRQLLAGERVRDVKLSRPLTWKINSARETFNIVFIRKLQALADRHGTKLFFLYLPRTNQSTPKPEFARKFEAATGSQILIPPPDLVKKLALGGRRDNTHINAAGRKWFHPWLVRQLESRCPDINGCI